MHDLGILIGGFLEGGEVIELVGDVGAGKTTLVRGIAEGLGVDETVQSPSFTISRLYEAKNDLRLAHYDFYRIDTPGIMADELMESVGDDKTVSIIEWADTVKDILPEDRLTITIESPSESSRRLSFHGGGETSNKLMEKIT